MNVIWTNQAFEALEQLEEYLLENDIPYSNKTIGDIIQATDRLVLQPNIGRIEDSLISLNLQHRFILQHQHKIIYRIENNTVYITDVFDTRQNPPKIKQRAK